MATIKGVRAEPGGPVRLTFSPDGFVVTRERRRLDLDAEHWLGIGLVGFVVLASLSYPLGARWLTWTLLVVAGLLLLALLVLGAVQLVGGLVGAAWLAGSALSRKGRRKLRQGARDLWAAAGTAAAGEYIVRRDQVRAAAVSTGFAGTTTVTLTMVDGQVLRYTSWRSRAALAAAFGG